MSPIGTAHAAVFRRLAEIFYRTAAKHASIGIQTPIHLDNHSEPEPDLVIALRRDDYYADHHPAPDKVILLIEVADTTLVKDLNVKLPLYAQAGVREVWVVDLTGQKMMRYRKPQEKAYSEIITLKPGDEIEIELPDANKLKLAVNQILGVD